MEPVHKFYNSKLNPDLNSKQILEDFTDAR